MLSLILVSLVTFLVMLLVSVITIALLTVAVTLFNLLWEALT